MQDFRSKHPSPHSRPKRAMRLFAAIAVACAALLGNGVSETALAQAEVCENPIFIGPNGVGTQYTICYAVKESFSNIVTFKGSDTVPVRLGPKTIGPVLTLSNGGNNRTALVQVFLEPTAGLPQGTVTVWGSAKWIGDSQATVIMNGTNNGVDLEEMRLDTPTAMIRNDLPDSYNLSSAPPGTVRNSTYTLNWLGRAQLAALASGAITDTTKLDMVFDLNRRLFTGTLPISLQIAGEQQNAGLVISPTVTFDPNGFKTGGVKDFTLKLGGFDMDVKNIGYTPGTFTAGQVDVLKSKNQAYAALGVQPGTSDLLFGFSGLKYTSADHKFSIAGGDVGVRDFNFSNRFKMINNRFGVLYDAAAGKTYASIKSTLQFPNHITSTTSITSSVLFGRKLFTETGQIERYFEGGVADFTGNLGPLKLNFKQTRVVGDQVSDFYGMKADQISASWNSIIGDGTSGAGMTGFKLGANAAGKVQFALNGGTVQFPQVQNGLFKGTGISGIVNVVSETVTFTATTTLSLKTAGGSKDSGGFAFNPVMSLILRAGPQVQESCAGASSTTCLRRVDGRIDDFSVGVAAFKFRLAGVRPLGDGGFGVQTATLTVPSILSAFSTPSAAAANASVAAASATLAALDANADRPDGDWIRAAETVQTLRTAAALQPGPSITVNGFKYNSDGSINIAGGQIELPPLKVGDYTLGGVKVGFLREVVSDTLFYTAVGGATFGIPDMDTVAFSLGAQITIRTKKDLGSPGIGDFDKLDFSVNLSFPAPGVPIVPPILTLDTVGGAGSISQGQQMFTASVGIGTVIQVGPFDFVRLNGTIGIRPKPFLMTGRLNTKLLGIFDLTDSNVEIGNGAGFFSCPPGQPALVGSPIQVPNPLCGRGKGLHFTKFIQQIPFPLYGVIDVRAGTVNGAAKIQGSAVYTVGIAKDTFFGLPRDPINLTSVQFQVGKFNVPYKSAETFGAMGTLNVSNNFKPSLFMDFAEECCFGTLQGTLGTQTGKLFNFGTNTDGYVFNNAALVQSMMAQNAPGYERVRVSKATGQIVTGKSAASVDGADTVDALTVPIVITKTGGAMVAFTYSSTVTPAPTINIVTPGSVTVTPANATANGFEYKSSPDAVNTDLIYYFVSQPGTYQLVIANPPASYSVNTMVLNNPPSLSNVVVTTARAGAQQNISWTAADADSPDAKVSLFYGRVFGGAPEPDMSNLIPIVEGLPLGAGQAAWDKTNVQTGSYKLVLRVYDGKNTPVNVVYPDVYDVTNSTPPAIPTGLSASSLPNQLLLRWNQNTESDIAGYEIGFALTPDSNQFIYTRDVGLREIFTGTAAALSAQRARGVAALNAPVGAAGVDTEDAVLHADETQQEAKLWIPSDGDTIYYTIRAYDTDGNFSPWASFVAGATWALSPKTYTPAPNGSGDTVIEVGFATPLNAATLKTNSIVVVDANTGAPVQGTVTPLYDSSEANVIALRFSPRNAVAGGRYRATLAGGAGGIAAADGRRMPDNFVWSFTFSATQPPTRLHLPIVNR